MSTSKHLSLALGTVAAALLGVACRESVAPERSIGTPNFHAIEEVPPQPPPCPALKMTGGGRIDAPPGGPTKNPPSSHRFQTFGAHFIQGRDQSGNCVIKGTLQWIDHSFRPDGRPFNVHSTSVTSASFAANTCTDGAVVWQGNAVIRNTREPVTFTAFDCDNGEPGAASAGGNDGFNIVLSNGYTLSCPERTVPEPACTMTGGNRQFHPTHS